SLLLLQRCNNLLFRKSLLLLRPSLMSRTLIHSEGNSQGQVNVARDFGQMLGHGIGVAPRHDEGCGLAEPRADRSEDIGRPSALVVRADGRVPRLAQRCVLSFFLTDTSLVLPPDFYSFAFSNSGGDLRHCDGDVF
ncbi:MULTISPECIES: hypothetical protein, partial [unclassified Rhizobium]|uniref:hypothetical protein n=1 Tax=unclassified Rhizobium TaxID=2613769 RepID=UPI001AEC9ABB